MKQTRAEAEVSAEILDVNIPKNEAGWWAYHRIADLEQQLSTLTSDLDAQLAQVMSVVKEREQQLSTLREAAQAVVDDRSLEDEGQTSITVEIMDALEALLEQKGE